MKKCSLYRTGAGWLAALAVLKLLQVSAAQPEAQPLDVAPLGVQGGLVIQLGAADTVTPLTLGRTGRFLVQVLDPDPAAVQSARKRFRAQGHYGLISAETVVRSARLPFTENLVNLVIVRNYAVPAAEMLRVLAPEGVLLVAAPLNFTKQQLQTAGFASVVETQSAGGVRLLAARKPWPGDMDGWSHPRHGPDGNAVSGDTLVGPPDRVRWVAAATQEVEGLVSAGGRNFYGGVLARDSFNGLRLWHRDLTKGEPNASAFALPRLSPNQARPIAASDRLFAIVRDKLTAVEASTGRTLFEFPGVKRPKQLAHAGGIVVAADESAVYAFQAATGRELWHFEAAEASNLVVGSDLVCFIHGRPKRGEKSEIVVLGLRSGTVQWRRADFPWLDRITRLVLHKDELALEESSMSDHDAGNALHLVSVSAGKLLWEKVYPPGMNHRRQARAMFLDSGLWILHGGKTNTVDKDHITRLPVQVTALDPRTGETLITHNAGLAHCPPPVATPYYLFAGVMDVTDLQTGKMVVNPITKAHCSTENGWVPANGLVYTTPKHCTCWPMLRGFTALAARATEENPARRPVDQLSFALNKGPAKADPRAASPQPSDWPLYRHDAWRSGSTTFPGPRSLDLIWSVKLSPQADLAAIGDVPLGPILHDWRENPFIKGPVSAPTVANGLVYVARPDAHEVVAVDEASGQVRWRFTAEGRVDTPPAIHRGLCLFGSQAGLVYAVRADNGELAWRLQAAPTNERIVAYGQVESPWPVPGAILILDDVAYFAAGRQPFADGGVLIFAIDPVTGERRWVRRLDTIPQKEFYENSGLEFDPFDILHQEGDGFTLSRWMVSRDGQNIEVDKWNAFARVNTGKGAAYVPRGWWTYAPRHQYRFPGEASRRPLCVFRDQSVYTSLDGTSEIFRRDFDLEHGEKFSSKWITGWEAVARAREGGQPYRSQRLAEKARWKADPFASPSSTAKPSPKGAQLYNDLHALALAGDGRLFVVHKDGRLMSLSTEDGHVLAETRVAAPSWDGLAIANRRLFLTTQTGELLCLGDGREARN